MKQIESMFQIATRTKLRLESPKGPLSVEQLWDIPLRSRDGFDLDTVAKDTNRALKEISEESFVNTSKSPTQGRLELALDLVKYVIEVKIGEAEQVQARIDNNKERERLMDALSDKQDDKLKGLSETQLKKRLRDLEAA